MRPMALIGGEEVAGRGEGKDEDGEGGVRAGEREEARVDGGRAVRCAR